MYRLEAWEEKITFLLKFVIVIATLLTAVTIVNDYLRDIYKVLCALSTPWLCYLSYKYQLYKRVEWLILACFLASYACTIALNPVHIVNELAMVGYLILLFSLSMMSLWSSSDRLMHELNHIARGMLAIITVYAVISLTMFLFSIGIVKTLNSTVYVFGMYQNRLWGLFNPNTGGMLYLSGILCVIYLFKQTQSVKIRRFYIGISILHAVALILCQSRSVWVCITILIIGYMSFIYKGGITLQDVKQRRSEIFRRLLLAFAIIAGLIIGAFVIREALSYIPSIISSITTGQSVGNHHLQRIEIRDESLNSVTTGRSAIWKMGLSAYETSPLFGIGFRSIDDVFSYMPTGVYLNSHMGGLHNVYLTVLVSAGAIGAVLFAGFIIYVISKGVKQLTSGYVSICLKSLLIVIAAILVAELAESRIMFGVNFIAAAFWLLLGYIINFYNAQSAQGVNALEQSDQTR